MIVNIRETWSCEICNLLLNKYIVLFNHWALSLYDILPIDIYIYIWFIYNIYIIYYILYIIIIYIYILIYIYIIYIQPYCNNYFIFYYNYFTLDRLLLVPEHMHIQFTVQKCYETSRQNKKKENLDVIKVLILLRLMLKFRRLEILFY